MEATLGQRDMSGRIQVSKYPRNKHTKISRIMLCGPQPHPTLANRFQNQTLPISHTSFYFETHFPRILSWPKLPATACNPLLPVPRSFPVTTNRLVSRRPSCRIHGPLSSLEASIPDRRAFFQTESVLNDRRVCMLHANDPF